MDYSKHPLLEMVKMCNCADCGKELLGANQEGLVSTMKKRERDSLPHVVGGRILGRPYCYSCLRVKRIRTGMSAPGHEPDPWRENAVRILEEDR